MGLGGGITPPLESLGVGNTPFTPPLPTPLGISLELQAFAIIGKIKKL